MSSAWELLTRRARDPAAGPAVIAEIGVNHNGDLDLAIRSIRAAVAAGADAVKFQTFRAEEFMADRDLVYTYRSAGRTVRESMYTMFKRLELPAAWHRRLRDEAGRHGAVFLSSAADARAVELLWRLGAPAIKIASEDCINGPLLDVVARTGLAVLLSTGMADAGEIDAAVDRLRPHCAEIVLLHCVSLYPTPDDQARLARIAALRERYHLAVGYSDHTRGIEAALAATALGAVVIEKHFTVDRGLQGPDHELSADPAEFAALVRGVARVARQLGEATTDPSPAELGVRAQFRRSVVAARDIPAGTVLTRELLALKRPATGLHPAALDELLGRTALRTLRADEPLSREDLA